MRWRQVGEKPPAAIWLKLRNPEQYLSPPCQRALLAILAFNFWLSERDVIGILALLFMIDEHVEIGAAVPLPTLVTLPTLIRVV
jgi:hypothetical protein